MPRPFVHINFAATASGDVSDGAAPISCRQDWARVHGLRERYDAVAVGACTWNTDRPRLSVREERLGRKPLRQPLRIVFAGAKDCAADGTDRTIFIGTGCSPHSGITYLSASGHDLASPLDSLWQLGIRSMLVEGGPTLIRSFLRQGLADEFTAYIACRCGDAAARAVRTIAPEAFPGIQARRFGDGMVLSNSSRPVEGAAEVKSEPVLFAIVAAPRTGSNMLCTMLNSHPEILCHHEIFNPAGIHYALDHRNGDFNLGTAEERDRHPEDFVRRVFGHRCGRNAVGFKLNRGQHPRAFHYVMEDPKIRKIVLRRRNRLKAFVSDLIAQQTGQWESYEFSDFSRPNPPVEIDLERLRDYLMETESYYSEVTGLLRSTGQDYLETAYEDLPSPGEQRRILSFLGVSDSAPLAAATRKRTPTDLRSVVSNFGDLRSALWSQELKADLESSSI